MTYNLFILVMLFKGGNFEPLPSKSLILLHKVASSIIVNGLCNKEFEYDIKISQRLCNKTILTAQLNYSRKKC